MIENKNEQTLIFSLKEEKEEEMKCVLNKVCDALDEKGYDSIERIVHYLLTDEPTYITNHKNARAMMCKLDRYELMMTVFKLYLNKDS